MLGVGLCMIVALNGPSVALTILLRLILLAIALEGQVLHQDVSRLASRAVVNAGVRHLFLSGECRSLKKRS